MNAGQVCAAGTRILVEKGVMDVFVARPEKLVADGAGSVGPIITEERYRKVAGYIALGAEEGATAISAYVGIAAGRQFIRPTIFVDVDNTMSVAREQIFGPVACVIPFETEDQAVAIANDSEYGLVSAVWNRNIDRAFRVAARLQTGQVFVNQFGTLDVEALNEFTQVKSVMIKIDDA